MKCKFCKADNTADAERCFSCNAPLPKRSNLNEQDQESLTNYIVSVENMLKKAKKNGNGKIALIFFVLSIVWFGASFYVYNSYSDDTKIPIIFSIVLGIILFFLFGASISSFEKNAMEKAFDNKIKHDIREYLEAMHFTTTDFQIVAGEVLNEKSPLNNFLTDI